LTGDALAAVEAAPASIRESLPLVFRASDFVAQACTRDGRLLADLISGHDLQRKLSAADIAARAPGLGSETAVTEAQFLAELRNWRRRELVRIAWRDLAGWAHLEETLADLTAFADAAIRVACEFARRPLVARYGSPARRAASCNRW
jgi:glutamate-ammonia-ligase adenylyltransferase